MMKVVNPSFNKLMIGMGLIVVLLLVAIAWMAGSLIAKKSAELAEAGGTPPVEAPTQTAQGGMPEAMPAQQAAPSGLPLVETPVAEQTAGDMTEATDGAMQQAATADATAEAEQVGTQTAMNEPDGSAETETAAQAAAAEQAADATADGTQTAEADQAAGGASSDAAQGLSAQIMAELADMKAELASQQQSGAKKEIYVYMKGKLVRLEDLDLDNLNQEDASYVEQLKAQAEAAQQAEQQTAPAVSGEQVKQAQAGAGEKKGLQLNQVTLGDEVTKKATGVAAELQQLAQAAAKPVEQQSGDEYVSTLKTVVKERENEVRYIRVQPGDSLWKIAERAYGSGFLYPKIFKANPQLKSPDMIQVGDLLRVPM